MRAEPPLPPLGALVKLRVPPYEDEMQNVLCVVLGSRFHPRLDEWVTRVLLSTTGQDREVFTEVLETI